MSDQYLAYDKWYYNTILQINICSQLLWSGNNSIKSNDAMDKYLFMTLVFCLIGHCNAGANVTETKVLVLGAGMSGIMAAKTLYEKGETNFIILEGSDRVGGRTREVNFHGTNVQVGSQWVYGRTDENPIYYAANKSNAMSFALSDADDWTVRNATGDDVTSEADEIYERFYEAVEEFELFKELMINEDRPDFSLRSAWRLFDWDPKTPLEHLCDWYEVDFEYAKPPEECSAKYVWFETFPANYDAMVIDEGGFAQLYDMLLDDFISDDINTTRLMLNTVVTSVEYSDDGVKVTTTDGHIYEAEYAIVTFSIGVLQTDNVKFIPELPVWKRESIHGFQMSHYMHFMMKFSSQFWDDTEYITHASSRQDYFPLFMNWNKFKPNTNILQAIVTGTEALRLHTLTDEEIEEEVMVILRNMYDNSIPDPTDVLVPRWSTDPLVMGSFTNWPPGFTVESYEALCAPERTLFFAGEACKREYFGFLHGAYFSGVETAETLVDCIKNDNCPNPYVPPYAAKGCMYPKAKNYNKTAQVDDGSCEIRECTGVNTGSVLSSYLILVLIGVLIQKIIRL